MMQHITLAFTLNLVSIQQSNCSCKYLRWQSYVYAYYLHSCFAELFGTNCIFFNTKYLSYLSSFLSSWNPPKCLILTDKNVACVYFDTGKNTILGIFLNVLFTLTNGKSVNILVILVWIFRVSKIFYRICAFLITILTKQYSDITLYSCKEFSLGLKKIQR